MDRFIENLISRADWAAIEGEDDEEMDWEGYIEETYYTTDIFPDVDEDPEGWAMDLIGAQPGVWVAELCRIKHDLPSSNRWIAWCGQCSEYVNPRKRARAKALGPALPGFVAGQYHLHPPCSRQAMTWLRKLTYRLEKAGFLLRKRERIPDCRQPRGWDWGTRLYIK